ncbi:unnamed protein product [Arabidopsis thaliana]|uniref:Uncharacterized protein n=2 Tax=Arabidopsis thaliana TaxID=3702 RepID=A0A654FBB7_ARATH|nr:uncharacterized protein AT3G27495 [Arabidopsis thaliana]ANM65272.1 hypothetical protein AT3G27495 [Arabidopsis thaliana]CAA0383893.1 unnamed protein product [Arabidopsis thaliana]VYS58809.1 unnamed protein product [Arabidopsis thaliana]|eukprot:NP_001327251.1 hypothetical protein AT3G27495 [Arabidopsis thaliana]
MCFPNKPGPFHSHAFMMSDLISPVTCDWDREKIREALLDLEQEILSLKLSTNGAEDTYIDQDSNKKGLVLDMYYKRVGRTYEKSMKSF